MRVNEVTYSEHKPIEGYGPGFFRIGGEVFEGDLLVSAQGVISWDGSSEPLLSLTGEVDVVFYGTGADIAHAPEGLHAAVEEAGMGLEVMNTPAACRTYNVLLSEGRRIALALKAV